MSYLKKIQLKTRLLIILGIVTSILIGFPNSDAFFEGGMVIGVPGQVMDISNNVISPGQTMFVNGTFNQSVDDFTANIFKDYEDSSKLVLTLSPASNEFGDFNFNFTIPQDWELGNYHIVLENGFQHMAWEFAVRNNYVGGTLDDSVYPASWMIDSPLKQFSSGIPIYEIECKETLILIEKHDGTTACVKSLTAEKLIERGSHMGLQVLTYPQYSISTGTYSGFCVGYCSTSFTITPEQIIILKTGATGEGPLLDQATQAQFSEKDWNRIVDSIDFQKFVTLPNKIGCPGCADAPVNWIEISDGNQTKKIEYENQDDIPEIKQLRTILEEITTALNSKLDQSDNKIITLDEKDKLVEIKKEEKFLVQLDSNYSWRIDIDNKTVVDSDYSDIRYSGSQAVYLAHNSGNTTITGVGDPHCQYLEPPCMSPSILFQIDVKVE